MKKRTAAIIGVLAMATVAAAGGRWQINRASDGSVKDLTVENVTSTLGIEKEFEVEVNAAGIPTRGTVSFTNGFKRDLKEGEMNLAWQVYGGRQVMWQNFKDQGHVVTLDQNQTPVIGKPTYIVTQGGIEYFGKVVSATKPDQFVLDSDGNSITFDKAPFKVFEQMR